MGRGMNISAIFDFDCLLQASHKSPELSLNIVFGDWSGAIEDRVKWHLVLEVALLEICRLLLELLERVDTALLKTKLAIADETSRAMPVVVGLLRDLRIEAIHVIAIVARFAD
jgi:hypothetical protein